MLASALVDKHWCAVRSSFGARARRFFFLRAQTLAQLAAMDYSQSEIASFYAGRSVFLTGGTGFLGKVRCWACWQIITLDIT